MLDLASEWMQRLAEWATDHRFVLINAGLLLVAGWFAARWAAGRVKKLGKRFGRGDSPYRLLIATFVRFAIFTLVVVATLPLLGLPTVGAVILLMAFTVVAALVAQAPLRNLTAGAMIHAIRPLKVGESIEAEGVSGTVIDIGYLATSLRSDDGVFITIPNVRLSGGIIRNYSRIGARRLDVMVVVSYEHDIDEAVALCRDVAELNGRVLREPPPEVVVSELRETAAAITIRAWTSSATYADATFQLNREIKKAFDMAGIQLAPTASRQPVPVAEPAAYITTAFRSRARSRAMEP